MNEVKSEVAPDYSSNRDNKIIKKALKILKNRMKKRDILIESPEDSKKFLRLKLSLLEHEVFAVMFLDSRHRLIEYVEMFRGTINGSAVHPREVIKEALKHNAAAVIFSHNHPSGEATPSTVDASLTKRLKEALDYVDIVTLDHIIVGNDIHSMADNGEI